MYMAVVGVDFRGGHKFTIDSQMKRYDPELSYYSKWAN